MSQILAPTDQKFDFADNLGRHHGAIAEDAAFNAAQEESSPGVASGYIVTPERNAENTEENCWQQLANVLGDSALLERWRNEQVTFPIPALARNGICEETCRTFHNTLYCNPDSI